ncbi:hypothetical protein [Carboxylicivirga sp. N1Y90]|uniref:hypothetical protein n=1 Tax=Carboxylicivirga fragile TaxID=3417571 RepID=UPI003D329BD5|nr:hypothetical protein [Marinilabiliaceae bacterium N1Y90]
MNKKIKQWLIRVEQKDKTLSKGKRQIKWLSILGVFFVLFLLSFFIGDKMGLGHQGVLQLDTLRHQEDSLKMDSPFELPVDSFEQLLNQQIHEDTHQKK